MASLVPVTDPGDPRLGDYTELRDVRLRRRMEGEQGLFIAEGTKVIERAVAAGHEVRSLLLAPRWLEAMSPVLATTDAPCFVLEEQALEALTGFHVHRGALASLHRRPLPSWVEVMAAAERVLVLEDVNDHTNVGAIFRNAAAFGWDGVLLSPRCADPLYRRAIKVSMGAVFALPFARLPSWERGPRELASAGFQVVALTPDPEADSLRSLPPAIRTDQPLALLVGSEGHGLSGRWLHEADTCLRIPMAPGVDSLNVAAATAVACYALAACVPAP